MAEAWQGIRLSFLSHPRYLDPLRTLVKEVTQLVGLDDEVCEKVVLAVQEAMANVIRHCYKDCPNERIDVVFSFSEEQVEIRIDDYGKWVDPATIKGRDLDDVRPGGLGVYLMNSVMDEVEYKRNEWGGTSLTMIKRAPPKPEGGVEMNW